MTVATIADASVAERGYAAGIEPVGRAGGVTGTGLYTVTGLEQTPELTFPGSSAVYDRMRRSDGQLAGVMRALLLPIRSTRWTLAGDDVAPDVLTFLRAELGLEETAGRARRRRQGIVFAEHLRDALLALPFGFMPFERVYEVAPPHPDAPVRDLRQVAHLRKLAPRMPRSLNAVEVRRDGGLAGIVQAAPPGATPTNTPGLDLQRGGIPIPAENLVMYVNDREGAEWTGNSVLRASYKHWLIKDALLRLGPMVVERNGMGIPVVGYPAGGDEAKALKLSRAFRAGSEAGAALEEGYTLTVVGVSGSTKDELPLVKYHDEAASRSLLAMWLDLGHDNGARALGDTFVDYFLLSEGAVIGNVEETFTEHVIRDLVALNFGPDEPYPMLKADELTAEASPTAVALKTLADAGLITPDGKLEDDLRRRYGLPAADAATARPRPAPAAPSPAAGAGNPFGLVDGELDDAGNPIDGPVDVSAHDRNGRPVPPHSRRLPTAAGEASVIDRLAALNERVLALRQ